MEAGRVRSAVAFTEANLSPAQHIAYILGKSALALPNSWAAARRD